MCGETTARSLDTLAQVAADLQRLYQVQATRLIVDRHPGYGYRRYARDSNLPLTGIWHHHAHAAALAWEFPDIEEWIAFAWDGAGLGEDGTLWGGEAFTGAPGRWRRAASFRPFRLPGGDKAGREPWRAAAALLWETGQAAPFAPEALRQAWSARLNSPASSSVGRLFDAAAALCGICTQASFEGEGPMRLEAIAYDPTRASARSGSESFRETLIYSFLVIASNAKQSRMLAESMDYGSPRPCGPRDDGINQRFLRNPHPIKSS
jgi:hydrogenase maturation protein HypF